MGMPQVGLHHHAAHAGPPIPLPQRARFIMHLRCHRHGFNAVFHSDTSTSVCEAMFWNDPPSPRSSACGRWPNTRSALRNPSSDSHDPNSFGGVLCPSWQTEAPRPGLPVTAVDVRRQGTGIVTHLRWALGFCSLPTSLIRDPFSPLSVALICGVTTCGTIITGKTGNVARGSLLGQFARHW